MVQSQELIQQSGFGRVPIQPWYPMTVLNSRTQARKGKSCLIVFRLEVPSSLLPFLPVYCLTYVTRILFDSDYPQVVRWCYYWWDHPQADRWSAQYLHVYQGLGWDGGAAGEREPKHCHHKALHCGSNLAGAFPGKSTCLDSLLCFQTIILLTLLLSEDVLFSLSLLRTYSWVQQIKYKPIILGQNSTFGSGFIQHEVPLEILLSVPELDGGLTLDSHSLESENCCSR